MTHLELINFCAQRFEAGWASATEIEWPNVASFHSSVPYVKFSVVISEAVNGTVGLNPPTKFKGYIIVQVLVSTNIGYNEAYSLAEDAVNILQNAQFNGILTYAGEIIEVGKDPDDSDLYVVNAQIPFNAM